MTQRRHAAREGGKIVVRFADIIREDEIADIEALIRTLPPESQAAIKKAVEIETLRAREIETLRASGWQVYRKEGQP